MSYITKQTLNKGLERTDKTKEREGENEEETKKKGSKKDGRYAWIKYMHTAFSYICRHVSTLLTISKMLLMWNVPGLLAVMVSVGSTPFSKVPVQMNKWLYFFNEC